MRLHRPVPLHKQPHLAGYFQGGGIPDGHTDTKSLPVAGAGFDAGGSVDPNAFVGSVGGQVDPNSLGGMSNANSGGSNSNAAQGVVDPNSFVGVPYQYDGGGQVDPTALLGGDGGVSDPSTADMVAQSQQAYNLGQQALQELHAAEQSQGGNYGTQSQGGNYGTQPTPQTPAQPITDQDTG